MFTLEDFFKAVDSNADDVIRRLGGSPALVVRFLSKFHDDGSFQDLSDALEKNDTETAFRAAHTLKGTSVNLGIQSLSQQASNVTEMLRAGNINEAKSAFPSLQQEYKRVLEALDNLES